MAEGRVNSRETELRKAFEKTLHKFHVKFLKDKFLDCKTVCANNKLGYLIRMVSIWPDKSLHVWLILIFIFVKCCSSIWRFIGTWNQKVLRVFDDLLSMNWIVICCLFILEVCLKCSRLLYTCFELSRSFASFPETVRMTAWEMANYFSNDPSWYQKHSPRSALELNVYWVDKSFCSLLVLIEMPHFHTCFRSRSRSCRN